MPVPVRCINCGDTGHGAWHFLNQGVPSAVIGALVFGVVAGLIVWRLTSAGETAALRRRLPRLLATEIEANHKTVETLRMILDGPGGYVVAEPFRVSALSITVRGRYAEAMAPEVVFMLADLFDELEKANDLHRTLRDRQMAEEPPVSPEAETMTELVRRELVGTLEHALEPRLRAATTALASA